MKRPQSAKMGVKGYWGTNTDEASQQNTSSKNFSKKQVVIMKPDLTSHDFSRILPKKIHQDKERLYSETLQLKQSLNEITEENIRLKTKISILEKQKNKMGKYIENTQQLPNKKSQSRLNLYSSKINEKQNNIIQNLKKLIRESKEQVEYLKSENMKIKKTMKYTKVNQVQIEKKILYDENKRIGLMLEDITQHINDQNQMERENNQLKKYLQDEMEENKALLEENQKYEEIVEELENKIRSEVEKYQTKEKKLTRDLALEKRKNQQNQKFIDDLRKQLNHLRSLQAEGEKNKVVKKIIRPTTSMPNKRYNSNLAVKPSTINPKEVSIPTEQLAKSETEEIMVKNNLLEQQLKQIKSKLEKSQNQLKERSNIKQKQNLINKPLVEKQSQKNIAPSNKVEVPDFKKQKAGSQKIIEQKPSQKVAEKLSIKKQQESYNEGFEKQDEEDYEEQFQKVDESRQTKLQEQIQKVKQDFQQNEEQQEIYKKQQSDRAKGKSGQKKKKAQSSKKGYKPNKKILAQIRELLTYRMKSQRYPFSDLKGDIESAESSEFTYIDLCDMFVNQPFHLTSAYAKALLNYCYESDNIKQNDLLKSEILVTKLRKVIQEFELMDEDEEKEMIIRISEMTSTYPQQLQAAFEDIKNGEETVSKKDLIEMFEKLQLEPKYIQLIIAELSLCSDDLEHLNFHGFFERFYLEEEDHNGELQNQAIEEEESEQSYRDASKKKKSIINTKKNSEDQEEDYHMGKYKMAVDSRVPEKPNKFNDDEDIVSDDGRI